MADDKKRSSSKSKSRPSSSSSSASSSTSKTAKEAVEKTKDQVKETAKTVKKGAKEVTSFLDGAFDGFVDIFGGYAEMDKTIKKWNPEFYRFATESFLNKLSLTNKASKLLMILIVLAILQTVFPPLMWPLDLLSQFLGFLFLHTIGISHLREGFSSSSRQIAVRTILTAFVLTTLVNLVPMFLFDVFYHFGGLWGFWLPVLMFTVVDSGGGTVASWVCEGLFGALGGLANDFAPRYFKGDGTQSLAIIAGAVILLLLWLGAVTSRGSHIAIYLFLVFSTITTVAHPIPDKQKSTSAYVKLMVAWHNLLAIWLWRYLISAIENISVPGVFSVAGWAEYHLPTYWLWMTAWIGAMLLTKKTADEKNKVANTWYARMLLGRVGKTVEKVATGKTETSEERAKRKAEEARKAAKG